MKEEYCGLLLFGQSYELAGRGIAGPRLRTSAMRAGFNVKTIDYINHLKVDDIYKVIDALVTDKTKFIGLSASWIDQNNIQHHKWYKQEFFDTIKSRWPHLLIITGGHDEYKKNFLLKNSDYHFHGYSDNSFVEFLKMIHDQEHSLQYYRNPMSKGYIINSNASHPVTNPDELETVFVEEDRFKSHHPLPIEVGRGCIFRCSFCRHPFQGKKNYDDYQRSVDSLTRELRRNYELFEATRYTVLDDTFNDSVEKIKRLQQAVKNAGLPKFEFVSYIKPELLVTKPEMIQMLADLGLRGAFVGIESFNQENRKAIGKGMDLDKVLDACRKLAEANNGQVLIHASFIVGLPNDTQESLQEMMNFLTSEKNTFFKSWHMEVLSIYGGEQLNSISDDSLSTMDKNPAKYGYKLDKGGWWSNNYWDFWKASAETRRLNLLSDALVKSGGWKVAGLWHAGIPDCDFDKQLPIASLRDMIRKEINERAITDLTKILEEKK